MEFKLQKYLNSKHITSEDSLLAKTAEIDALLAICAWKGRAKNLRDELLNQWQRITKEEVTDSDRKFVKSREWGAYPFGLFGDVKKKKITGVTLTDQLQYLRRLWFFIFMARNYQGTDRKTLRNQLEEIKQRELDAKFLSPFARQYALSLLSRIYNGMSTPDKAYEKLWKRIETDYLAELEEIFAQAKSVLLKKDEEEFSNWFAILEDKQPVPVATGTPAKAAESVSAASTPAREEGTTSAPDIPEQPEKPTEEPSAAKDTPIKEEKTPEQEVIKLIKHQPLPERKPENYSELLDENIRKIYDLSEKLVENAKCQGVEKFIRTLNSEAYATLLDKLYFVTQHKEDFSGEYYSMACLIKNALEANGFAFAFYPDQQVGTCIGAPTANDTEYIYIHYRYKQADFVYKNLYIAAPGIINKKTNVFVYPPLVEVK